MKLNHPFYLVITTLFFCWIQSCADHNEINNLNALEASNDSITEWIKSSKNSAYDLNQRKQFLVKSYQALKAKEIDTKQVRQLSTIAYQNFKLGDDHLFKKQNEEILGFAKKIKDSFAIGDVHWNYATYYNRIEVYDSAYYHFNLAYRYFSKSDHLYESAKTQYGMAFVRGRFRDYSGSEILTINAITKFKALKDYKSLYSCYNHLAQLQNDIYEYDRALFYYEKAIEYAKMVPDNELLYASNLNNIGNTYLKMGEYKKAITYFDEKLKIDSLKSLNTNSYAITLDNKGYCKLLMNDLNNTDRYLYESLRIRDSLNNKSGIVISKIHLSNYHAFLKDTMKAITYAKDANELAKQIKNSRDYLASLLLLEKFDTKHSKTYLQKHINFNDSLLVAERKIQNKFTRIAFETDEYIEENKRLSQQKIWITVTGFALLSILGLLYFIKNQNSNNEKLRFENEQQKSNEQVYLITLKQQEKLEKEKIKERNRISEELHDGILGKLFGIRVGLGFLDIKGNDTTKLQHETFLNELQTLEKEIREVSHKLSDNFDSKQINFTTILQQMLDNKSKIGGFSFNLEIDEQIDWHNINEVIKVNLYRIIQEALQNIVKYADAKHVEISFAISNNSTLIMSIIDDGKGFNLKRKSKGIGIKNMKSRTEKLNGSCHIESVLNHGTKIEIQIQLNSAI